MKKKLTTKQKLFHFLGFPLLTFIVLYLIGNFFMNDFTNKWDSLELTIGFTIIYWVNKFYPEEPPKDPNKPESTLKEDIKKYTVDGSPFNRLMVAIYSFIILLAVFAFVWGAVDAFIMQN